MKSLWRPLSIMWMVIAAWTFAPLAWATLFGFLVNPAPWNFPGDPPLFEFLLFAGVIPISLTVPLWLLSKRFGDTPALVRRAAAVCALGSVFLVVIAGPGILERRSPRWNELRGEIRRYGDAIATAAGDKDRVLSPEEFDRFKQQFVPKPIVLHLRGHGRVQLRMAHGIYPYVGVDFSDAGHALFDPVTIRCTYSD